MYPKSRYNKKKNYFLMYLCPNFKRKFFSQRKNFMRQSLIPQFQLILALEITSCSVMFSMSTISKLPYDKLQYANRDQAKETRHCAECLNALLRSLSRDNAIFDASGNFNSRTKMTVDEEERTCRYNEKQPL